MNVEEIRGLRESTTPWQMCLRPAPGKSDPVKRYQVLLIVSPGANTIRCLEAVEGMPSPSRLEDALAHAMVQRPGSHMPSARPPAIAVDDEALAEAIAPLLDPCGIQVHLTDSLPAIVPVMERLAEEDSLFSTRRRPRLVEDAPTWEDEPEDALPYLIPFEHAVSTAEITPELLEPIVPGLVRPVRALVLRCEPERAPSLAACLQGVDTLAFGRVDDELGEQEVVLGLGEGRVLGAVTVCPLTHDRLPLRDQLIGAAGDSMETLVIVAQGPPGKLRRPEIVAVKEVCLSTTADL